MNEYTKISLAGVSFNLENDAYSLLEEYLEELSTYYGKEKDGKEIISDIEERIAELFIERKGRERIISKTDVIQIIDTLGRPSEIESGAAKEQKSEQQPVKRKLYRDINNKIIGGVLSGFANFFKTDPVFVRLIYVFITVLFFFMARGVHSGLWFWGMIILYFLLCLIMPPAKTVSQRCAMAGVSTGIDDIQNSKSISPQKESSAIGGFISVIGRILQIISGIILIALGFGGLLLACIVLFGIEVYNGVTLVGALDYITLGISAWIVKTLCMVTYLLFCILLLYWGIKCCFRFKSPKWRPGLTFFIAFIILAIAASVTSTIAARPYYNYQSRLITQELEKNYDTLYVKINGIPASANITGYLNEGRHYYDLFYIEEINGEKNNLKITVYPELNIRRDDDNTVPEIQCRYSYFRNAIIADNEQELAKKCYTVTDSLITINPISYSKENKFEGKKQKLYFYLPENCVIEVMNNDLPNINREGWGQFGKTEEE